MSFEIRSEIVAVLAERGGKFAAPMLDAVGVFDPAELEDAWPHDEVWVSAHGYARFPLRYLPSESNVIRSSKSFLTVRSVAEMLTSLVSELLCED